MRAQEIYRKLTGKLPSGRGYALSTPGIHAAVLRAVETSLPPEIAGDYLDIGSGKGELLTLLMTDVRSCSPLPAITQIV